MKKAIIISVVALFLVIGTVKAVTVTIDGRTSEVRELLDKTEQTELNQQFDRLGGLDFLNATSTATNVAGDLALLNDANPFLIRSGSGTFGSYIVTEAGKVGGIVNVLDATTTIQSLRTGQLGTSSIMIASMPTDLTAGDYEFNVNFNYGLLIETNGTVGTTTYTYD